MPIGQATGSELGVSVLLPVLRVATGASAAFLTLFVDGVRLMVHGPGGYRFGDCQKLRNIVMVWLMAVTVVVIPLYWKF
jgi:di/tricarboxylate transporter